MDKNETIITGATIIAGQKSAVGGSMVFSSMVIFNDPAYIIIGLIGAMVSVGSEYYDLIKMREEETDQCKVCRVSIGHNLFKAFLIGLLFTMMSFMFFTQAGESLIKHVFGLSVATKLLPSFWMILTIYLSTKSIAIYNTFSKKMGWS